MLRNRFMRLLTTILMFIAISIITSSLEITSTNNDWTWNIPDGTLFLTPTITFAVCIVAQILGDILNVDSILNNAFVTFLKRLVFFAVVIAGLLVGTGTSAIANGLGDMLDANASVIEIGVCLASAYAPAFALLSYVIGYILYSKNYHDTDDKKWLPFFFPISYFASIILGIILAAIITSAELDFDTSILVLIGVEIAIIIISIVACGKSGTWPFEEEGYYYSSSYSSSSSSSYSGYSGNSSSSNSTSTDTYDPYRKCKYCAYHSKYSPLTGLYGTDYCVLHKEYLGPIKMDDACSSFVKER